MGHKNVPNIVSLSLLGTIIFLHFNSYLGKGKKETHATMLLRRPCTILEDVIFLVYFLSARVLMRT